MSDHEDETLAVSTSQNAAVTGTITVSSRQNMSVAGTLTVSASQNSTTAPATQAVPHSMPKDIRMHAFIADSDPNETGCKWKKWRNELVTRFTYFRIANTQDRIDTLNIYRGEQI